MQQQLKFLVSGPGLIGKKHCALIGARPDCILAGIVAPQSEENRATAAESNAVFFDNFDAALFTGDFDAAIISSPNAFHFDQAMACVRRGLPVLVEKPVTDTLETARALADEAEARGVPVLVGHHRTHSTLLTVAEQFLQSEKFGRLVSVMGSAQFYKPAHYFRDGEWRTRLGGGPILINMIHEIGLMRHFCGEIVDLVALASNAIRRFEVEDTVSISLRFANGALGTFILSDTAASSKSWEMTAGENPAYPHFPNEYCYHFAGTNGSLDFPSMQVRTYSSTEGPSWWVPFGLAHLDVSHKDPLELQLAHFVDVIRGKAEPLVSARDGYKNMLVIEAIQRSVRTGQIVHLGSMLTS